MESSTIVRVALLTVLFVCSVKFSAGFPSTTPEKISDDLNAFEDMRSLPCEDEMDKYHCFFEIAIAESCELKPLTMMKQCRYSCSFCTK